MSMKNGVQRVTAMIDRQVRALQNIVDQADLDREFDAAEERLRDWRTRTQQLLSEQVHPDELENFKTLAKTPVSMSRRDHAIKFEGFRYRDFLKSLSEAVQMRPEDVLLTRVPRDFHAPPAELLQRTISRMIFIVHGHDEPNRLRLEKLLRDRWDLEPIVLIAEPGKGRTVIEKFEQEAQRAAYAIVLFTPDDLVEVSGTKYTQARPNAIFELGCFYGRLGRDRVCILFQKGTKIPSDLDGITRIEFDLSVNEKIEDIEKELAEAGLL